jgi:hypothetical protein
MGGRDVDHFTFEVEVRAENGERKWFTLDRPVMRTLPERVIYWEKFIPAALNYRIKMVNLRGIQRVLASCH